MWVWLVPPAMMMESWNAETLLFPESDPALIEVCALGVVSAIPYFALRPRAVLVNATLANL